MITIAIIEDEPAIRKEISFLIEQEPDTHLLGWSDNVKDAVKLISNQQPDVILMDIQLIDGTAFDVLKNLDPFPENIIFITAYNQFAIKAIKYGALDYLLKPIEQGELKVALQRFRQRRDKNPNWMQQLSVMQETFSTNDLPERIALHTLNNVRIVNVADILYCKGDGPYTFFYLSNGEKELISKPLKFYEDLLPSPYFLRTHQSYLVNRNCVMGISKSEYLLLNNKEEIPISMRRKTFILSHLSLKDK
ncbi:two-component system LytT family response regulator [Flavobacterium arsenatis]|uniref:Two-component system LytT family response regulator n=1 Tax=Flavobacterium arsenatis TaxID=1484332 RepID=A0ABU1TUH6_9FLAO|nr:LytTR family DNA-binding domain-containing protein [Flavobacterium arsenatis]MDR6969532.1 two-component system LytT family response regulator [Flavobacterium arsenatis]